MCSTNNYKLLALFMFTEKLHNNYKCRNEDNKYKYGFQQQQQRKDFNEKIATQRQCAERNAFN